jgi:hypothetical protein
MSFRSKCPSALFILSGWFPLLGLCQRPADTTLLIYSCFVAAWLPFGGLLPRQSIVTHPFW